MQITQLQELVKSRATEKPRGISREQWILEHQPTTFKQWQDWIDLLGRIIDEEVGLIFGEYELVQGHKVPLRWGFEIYCLCSGRSEDDTWTPIEPRQLSKLTRSFVIKHSRGGSKTLMLALVGFTLMRWNRGYTWTHTGAIKEQAERLWGYLRSLLTSDSFKHLLKRRMSVTTGPVEFNNGSSAFITTGTEQAQNSKHPQLETWDEVEYIEMSVIREGRLAGMQKRRRGGHRLPPVIVYCSTQKRPNETMFVLMAEAEKGKHNLILGNVWDVIERCEPWRWSNLPPGVKCEDWEEINKQIDQLERMDRVGAAGQDRLQGLHHQRKALEDNCTLCRHCRGIAKHGTGHYSIDDAIDKTKDPSYFRAQMLCEQPQMENAVYPMFSQSENVLGEAVYIPEAPVAAFVDYGFTQDPTFLQLNSLKDPYVLMFYEEEILNKAAARTPAHFRASLRLLGIPFEQVEFWAVDANATELIHHMRDDGFNVMIARGARQRKISYGVEKATELIFDDGFRRLLINPKCVLTIRCIMVSEKAADGNPKRTQYNHPEAALRYGAIQLVRQREGESRIIYAGRRPGRSLRR